MQFIRTTTKTESVDAETPEQGQTAEGKTIDITVRVAPRPQQALAGQIGPFQTIPTAKKG